MKRLAVALALVLCFVLSFSSCSIQSGGKLAFYSNENGTCSVSIGTCSAKKISIPERSPEGELVIGINYGGFAFSDELSSIKIPDSVETIKEKAFQGCSSLSSVTIGVGVKRIEKSAFAECGKLTTIIYQGTRAQWNQIWLDSGWDLNTGDYIIQCTDGTQVKGTESSTQSNNSGDALGEDGWDKFDFGPLEN